MKQRDLFAERVYDHISGEKVVLRIFIPALHGGNYPGKDDLDLFNDVFDADLCDVSPWICYFTIEGLPPKSLKGFHFGTDSLEALTNSITAAYFILRESAGDLKWFGESLLGIGQMIPDHYGPELVAQIYSLIDRASESRHRPITERAKNADKRPSPDIMRDLASVTDADREWKLLSVLIARNSNVELSLGKRFAASNDPSERRAGELLLSWLPLACSYRGK